VLANVNPALALAMVVLGTAALIALFWPVKGLWWRWRRGIRASDRVRIEDALKHVYDCESHANACTLPSLSGALNVSGNRAAEIAERLSQLELVQSAAGRVKLTSEGRSYALRVIRVHRLWERYLSDKTGVDASEWHVRAEEREHKMTAEEADELAARMGYPRFDPHGDPIPTSKGEVIPPSGKPLTDIGAGDGAEIVHVEDEPEALYAQILAEGLHPGMRVRVLQSSPHRVRFEADGEEHVLAHVVAANLSVVPLEEEAPVEGPFARLSGLSLGERATVTGISGACRGPERRRMLDLGIVPGTEVEAEMSSPGGDPIAYRVRGALIALRREQADLIHVAPVDAGATS
jgi:DtxR family Mn-dependent transcriptional regulator